MATIEIKGGHFFQKQSRDPCVGQTENLGDRRKNGGSAASVSLSAVNAQAVRGYKRYQMCCSFTFLPLAVEPHSFEPVWQEL